MPDNLLKGGIKFEAPGLEQTTNAVVGSLRKMSSASYLARDAVNDMSHELRDLPYALNNPAMLAGPFGKLQALFFDLKQQTGSTEGAFKALGSSLMGGGGLLLAGNLLVSALAILGPKLFNIGEGAKSAGDKFKDLKKSLDEYTSSLTPFNQALLKGQQNSEEEITKLNVLYKATQNTTLSIKERKKATEELKDLFPSVFQSMSDETIMNGKAQKSYESLKTVLLETAKAQALLDEAVDLYKQSDAAEAKLKAANAELKKLKENLRSGPQTDLATDTADRIVSKEKERNKLAQDYLDIYGQINEVQQKIEEHPSAIIKPKFGVAKIDKEEFRKRVHEAILNDGIPEAFVKELQDTLFSTSGLILDYKPNPEYVKYLQKTFEQLTADTFNPLKAGQKALVIPITASLKFQKSKSGLDSDEIKGIAKTIEGTLTPAFENLFTAIEQGKPVLQSFFQSIEQSLLQLISKLIAAAAEAAILKMIFSATQLSGAGFGSGSFADVFKSIAHFSSGGEVPGVGNSDSVPALLTPGEYVIPKQYAQQVKALLKGNIPSLGSISSLATPMFTPSMHSGMGGIHVTVGGTLRADGYGMKAVLSKVEQKQSRAFS